MLVVSWCHKPEEYSRTVIMHPIKIKCHSFNYSWSANYVHNDIDENGDVNGNTYDDIDDGDDDDDFDDDDDRVIMFATMMVVMMMMMMMIVIVIG